jgi:hypothetical protein
MSVLILGSVALVFAVAVVVAIVIGVAFAVMWIVRSARANRNQ